MLLRRFALLSAVISLSSAAVLASPGGYTGRTLKTSTSGCGGCHGSGRNTGVTVAIAGPATVVAGAQATYTVTVSGFSGSGGGVNIAARRGTLAAVSSTLQLSGGELTHRSGVTVPSTYQLTFTAPATAGTDTIYATGKTNGDRWNWAPNFGITVTPATGVDDGDGLPLATALAQNYPNPFNPSTVIRYDLPARMQVQLTVLDLTGKMVATLVDGERAAGSHTEQFDASRLAGGVYFYRLATPGGILVRKMVLTK